MKTIVTTAVVVAALTVPAFAEGDIAGDESLGQAYGTINSSLQDLYWTRRDSFGQVSMAQGELRPSAAPARASAKTKVRSEGASAKVPSQGASAKVPSQGASAKVPSEGAGAVGGLGFTPAGSGMDGGNRK
jgi:hypothetical protein